ncbi:hypothetical protein EWB00_006187 [Schistosoma japonicum]|uniref:Uncharacterized protein n=1 Tax=Schistosoma japonicum TaxID=6182 RepID=A0A4Z2CZP2_SCHJA|nr:hypothetical protein EWB00_006187 [Schistosoma japonicum]
MTSETMRFELRLAELANCMFYAICCLVMSSKRQKDSDLGPAADDLISATLRSDRIYSDNYNASIESLFYIPKF